MARVPLGPLGSANAEAVGRTRRVEGWHCGSKAVEGEDAAVCWAARCVYGEGLLTTLFMSLDSTCPTKVSSLVSRAASPADGDPGG